MANFTVNVFHIVNVLPHWSEVFRNYANAFNIVAQGIGILVVTYYGYKAMRTDGAQARDAQGQLGAWPSDDTREVGGGGGGVEPNHGPNPEKPDCVRTQ